MERKLGEKFKYADTTIKVIEDKNPHTCSGCYFQFLCFYKDIYGECRGQNRSDGLEVKFEEI